MRLYWNKETGEWSEKPPPRPKRSGVYLQPDIQPYRNVIDGEVIGGRRQHRDFLRAHGCIEVGNEKVEPRPSPEPDITPAFLKAWSQLGYD